MEPDTDEWLDRSVPTLSEPDDLGEVLVELVASTRRAAQPRRRKPRRAVLIGTTSAMLLAGGTAAAAATIGGWTAPWTDRPLGTLDFRLPSGGTCEQRIGDLHIANTKAQSLVQRWLSDHTLDEVADVEASISAIRADRHTWENGPGGSPITFGYGRAYYDADYEYVDAVFQAESAAVTAKLNDAGFTNYIPVTWASELRCSGSNPAPGVPEWAK